MIGSRSALASLFMLAVTAGSTWAQVSDVTPPQLTLLSVLPATVDVSTSSQNVLLTFTAGDNLSGVGFAGVEVGLPGGFFKACPPVTANRTAGNAMNGTYMVTVNIPPNAPAGQWPLRLYLVDAAGNEAFVSASDLAGLSQPSFVTVLSATPDTTAPQVTGISFVPSAVDASTGDVQVRVRVNATDASTGVFFNPGCSPSMTLLGPNNQQIRLFGGSFSRVAGTAQSGTWEASFFARQFSSGGWSVASLTLDDAAGNSLFYSNATLVGLGINPTLPVTSTPSDVVPPLLTSFNMSPAVINTSTGAQGVTFTLGLQDDLSGVSFNPDTFFHRIWFASPSGIQINRIVQTDFTLLSGDRFNGVWEARMVFPQFSETGTWRPFLIFRLEDRVHNVRNVTQSALEAAGFPSTLEVFQPSLTSDGSVGSGGGTVQDTAFQTRASLTFPPGALSVPTTVAIDVLQSPLNVPLPTGFSGADTFFVNVELTPTPVYPLPPPGLTLVLPLRSFVTPGTAIYLFRVDPITGSLQPAYNAAGGQVLGFVHPSGLEATFTNVTSFSTVVGLRSGPITLDIDVKPGDTLNVIKPGSKGTLPVVIYSTPTLDATRIDPQSLRLAGARVAVNKSGKHQVSAEDVNGDGLVDLLAHFESEQLQLTQTSAAFLEGTTFDFREVRGIAAVKVLP
jgi:hypothetical protein